MNDDVRKPEFVARVAQSRARWDRLAGRLSPEEALLPGFCERWSLIEVLAHIAWYEREMVNLLQARSFAGSPLWALPLDERNARIHQDMQQLDPAAVWTLAAQTFADLMRQLDQLPEASLSDPAAFPGMPSDWKPWELIASNTYEHYADHAQQAEAWITRRQGGA